MMAESFVVEAGPDAAIVAELYGLYNRRELPQDVNFTAIVPGKRRKHRQFTLTIQTVTSSGGGNVQFGGSVGEIRGDVTWNPYGNVPRGMLTIDAVPPSLQ